MLYTPIGTSVLGEINRFRQMSVAELRQEWERLYGEPARSSNKDFLFRRLAWEVQARAHGGRSDAANVFRRGSCAASNLKAGSATQIW